MIFVGSENHKDMGQIGDKGQSHLIESFLCNNQLDHITRLIGFHPQYLDPFLRTQHFIFKGDGPLPFEYRHFIAIMAASRLQCAYLVDLQKLEFLKQGGNEKWLEGLENVPKKLRDLNEITKILAHRPWLISKSHVEELTKGKGNWSLSEFVQAIIIITHFHALSSFVFGCGLHVEVDGVLTSSPTDQEKTNRLLDPVTSQTQDAMDGDDSDGGVEELMKKMKILEDQKEEMSQEELALRYAKVESQSVELSVNKNGNKKSTKRMQLIDDPDFAYEDFSKRGEPTLIPTFRVQDYSWDHHGYSLVNRLYNDVGTLLDEKFKVAYNLTYYSMGRKNNVDTSMFRIAVWNYIQCMYGIRHDDYDYREVNELIERNLKAYIKTVCCFPERTTKSDFDNVMKEFRHSEKIHVNLMVIEAKFQAELLYALRAVMCYMT